MEPHRWISFHDADVPSLRITPGEVLVNVGDAETGIVGSSEASMRCEAELLCVAVTNVLVVGFTNECEYVSDLEYRPQPGAPFRVLNACGPTSCAEVKITLWPRADAILIQCSTATLRLANDA